LKKITGELKLKLKLKDINNTFFASSILLRIKRKTSARRSPVWLPGTWTNPMRSALRFTVSDRSFGQQTVLAIFLNKIKLISQILFCPWMKKVLRKHQSLFL
jgi:hypothetical protein